MQVSNEGVESILTTLTTPTNEEVLITCQYCDKRVDAYWFKHHNCPEKETALTETIEAYIEG